MKGARHRTAKNPRLILVLPQSLQSWGNHTISLGLGCFRCKTTQLLRRIPRYLLAPKFPSTGNSTLFPHYREGRQTFTVPSAGISLVLDTVRTGKSSEQGEHRSPRTHRIPSPQGKGIRLRLPARDGRLPDSGAAPESRPGALGSTPRPLHLWHTSRVPGSLPPSALSRPRDDLHAWPGPSLPPGKPPFRALGRPLRGRPRPRPAGPAA